MPDASILLSGCHQKFSRYLDGTPNWPLTILIDTDCTNRFEQLILRGSFLEETGTESHKTIRVN